MKTSIHILLLIALSIACGCKKDSSTAIESTSGKPVVHILSPLSNQIVTDTLHISLTATHLQGISHVEFYFDDSIIKTWKTEPYSWMYLMSSTNAQDSSVHTLYARATANDSTQQTTPVQTIIFRKIQAPSFSTVSISGTNSIYLSWAANSNKITGFLLDHATDGVHYTRLANLSASSRNYVYENAIRSEEHYFRIFSIQDTLVSPPSTPVSISFPTGVYVRSIPSGAAIYKDGLTTGKNTPAVIDNLIEGRTYVFSVETTGFYPKQATFSPMRGNVDTLTLTLEPKWIQSNSDTLWESSSVKKCAYGIRLNKLFALTNANKDSIDIFYSSANYSIKSADQQNASFRQTRFKIGNSNNLFDGVDAPETDASWVTSIPDRTYNYIFACDSEGHYVKFLITLYGGGTSISSPAWLKLRCLYKTNVGDRDF